jgi:hypothetical protein
MKPQEKAIELVHKFYDEIPLLGSCSLCNVNYKCENKCENKYKSAKQCALVSVEEVLNADWFIPTKEDSVMWSNYWNEVKKEIENL